MKMSWVLYAILIILAVCISVLSLFTYIDFSGKPLLINFLNLIMIAVLLLLFFLRNREFMQIIQIHNSLMKKDKKQKELLRLEQQLFHQIYKSSPIGISIVDIKNEETLLDINQAYADMLGYSIEELKSGDFAKAAYEPDLAKCEKEYDKLIQGMPSTTFDKHLVKKDGELITVRQRMIIIRDDLNDPFYLVGMTIDITEQIKTVQELRENEKFYQTVLENMSGIVYNCAFDQDWTMYYMSPQIEKITGYKAEDLINNAYTSYNEIIHQDDRNAVRETVTQGVESGEPYRNEYRLKHRNGDIIWVYEEGRGIYDDNGELSFLSGTIIDINDRKDSERKLKEYKDHLEDMVEKRTRDIKAKNKKLEEINRLFVGRELRIKQLRDQIKELNKKNSDNYNF